MLPFEGCRPFEGHERDAVFVFRLDVPVSIVFMYVSVSVYDCVSALVFVPVCSVCFSEPVSACVSAC